VPRWPQVLEDGRLIYSASAHSAANPDIELYDPRTDKRTTLVRNATYGRYLPNGSLAYLSGGTVFTVPIDLSVGKTSAAPTAALKDVSYSSLFGYAQFAFARNGTLVYRRARAGNELAFVWLERSGAQTRLPIEPGEYLWPKLAPDAQRFIYMAKNAEHHDLWMHDLRTGQTSRLTSGDATYGAPTWSVDGTYIVFTGRAGTLQWTRPGVQATPQDVAGAGNVGAPWSMSPDGRLLASHGRTTEQGFDLWMTPISSDGGAVRAGQREVFRGTMAYEVFPAFSPDGKWLAYASNESGTWQVYVRAFPDTGTVVQVSSQGGRIPAWSRTTRKLFYETDDHRLMMTEYRLEGGAIEFSTPTPWSPVRLADTGVLANYDVSPDGERVLALVPADASVPLRTSELSLVTNFF
jgi:serine/threonine-protein kinase